MLIFYFFSWNFFKSCQNNLYVDFLLKKIAEIFVKNIFIYSAIFFGEKFLIEYFTKKIIESYVFFNNQNFNFFTFYHSFFFLFNISIFCLLISLINIVILFI